MGWGQSARLAVELGAVVTPVEVDGQLADRRRQSVVKRDLGPVAGGPADRRAGEGPAVGPHPRPLAGQDLDLGLADRDRQVGVAQDLRDRQGYPEGQDTGPGRRVTGWQQRRGAQAPRQRGGKRTAAQGAEESSAPQARCF